MIKSCNKATAGEESDDDVLQRRAKDQAEVSTMTLRPADVAACSHNLDRSRSCQRG